MSAIITASIRVDKLPKEKFIKGKDGAVYYNLTKAQRNYLGNGKVVWTNDIIKLAEKEQVVQETVNDDLPF